MSYSYSLQSADNGHATKDGLAFEHGLMTSLDAIKFVGVFMHRRYSVEVWVVNVEAFPRGANLKPHGHVIDGRTDEARQQNVSVMIGNDKRDHHDDVILVIWYYC